LPLLEFIRLARGGVEVDEPVRASGTREAACGGIVFSRFFIRS
jgi:hypothetical protein